MSFCPIGVCLTSGCHCTPYSLRAGSCMAATGAPSVCASTSNPSGAASTATPWLIHTLWSAEEPSSSPSALSITVAVLPYSPNAALSTLPPSS